MIHVYRRRRHNRHTKMCSWDSGFSYRIKKVVIYLKVEVRFQQLCYDTHEIAWWNNRSRGILRGKSLQLDHDRVYTWGLSRNFHVGTFESLYQFQSACEYWTQGKNWRTMGIWVFCIRFWQWKENFEDSNSMKKRNTYIISASAREKRISGCSWDSSMKPSKWSNFILGI